jgi:Peptidase propeptide and YPEB domain./S-layer homology domain.
MKLSYKTNYYSIYNNGKSETVKKAFLVYEPDVSYISVDAKTGEVYLTRNEWVAYGSIDEAAKSAESNAYDAGSAESASLTEEEIAKIRELENLISKNKAIEIVTSNPYLYIDKNLISYTATLHKTYMTSDKEGIYVWRIELEDNRPVDYSRDEDTYRAYANATVDAKTGKILSFHASLNSSYDNKTGTWNPVKIKYNREEGKSIFEKFLNGQIKDRFDKTKLVNQTDDYIAYYNEKNEPVYGGYYYAYNRYNEGVEFPYNGIYGSVDGVTGKIYSYYFYWDDDVVFESPKNAITPEEAFKHYIAKDGFDLMYEVNVINQYDPNYKSSDRYYEYSEAYSVNYEVRLVYRPDINPGYISPFTGEQLDYNGEVYKNENAYVYEDIAETDENRQILILADMNIGFEGGTFKPDQAVTHEEVSQILKKLGYYLNDEDSGSNSSKPITREELAYDFISRLELKKIAKLSGIYKTDYSDENNISREYLGAVALAKALDIFPEYEDNLFNPKQNVTRREFVGLTFKLIKAANNINNY